MHNYTLKYLYYTAEKKQRDRFLNSWPPLCTPGAVQGKKAVCDKLTLLRVARCCNISSCVAVKELSRAGGGQRVPPLTSSRVLPIMRSAGSVPRLYIGLRVDVASDETCTGIDIRSKPR